MNIILLICIAIAQASIIKRDTPKVLKLDFDVVRNKTNTSLKRDYVNYGLIDNVVQYMIELTAGSNKQSFQVALDTGSSDLWVATPYAACPNNQCKVDGSFNPHTSTTWKNLSTPILDYYVDNSYSFGDYGTDDFYLPNGSKLSQLQFGAMYNTTETFSGLLGIDYPIFESTYFDSKQTYNNFPMALQSQGIIDQVAYSLYLNQEYFNGVILFGGIDTTKYNGNLTILDVSTEDLSISTNDIQVDGESIGFQGDIVLDSGSTNIFLQQEYSDKIWQLMNVAEGGYVSCDQPDDKFLTFKFNGIDINIPYSALIRPSDQFDECFIGVSPTISGTKSYAGDFFLRSVYAAYNLETRKIGIAQAAYNTKGENLVDFWF